MSTDVELWISLQHTWHHAFSIPPAECRRFSIRPAKWIRYLGYATVGRQGRLSASPDPSAPPADYDALEILPGKYYYHCSPDGDPCLIDPLCMDGRTSLPDVSASSVSDVSASEEDFRERILARDHTCVLTGAGGIESESAHLFPHSKGDDYIECYTGRRAGDGGTVERINSARNGLFLMYHMHFLMDMGWIAFLKTPNFALSNDDIPTAQDAPPFTGQSRLCLHYFTHSTMTQLAPHGSTVRQPTGDNRCEWPTDAVFDTIYGSAALRHWGRREFIQPLEEEARVVYYGQGNGGGGGPSDSHQGRDGRERSGDTTSKEARPRAGKRKRDEAARSRGDMLDLLMTARQLGARGRGRGRESKSAGGGGE